MEKPATKYRVAIDHMAREYKTFDTEEQAAAFAREMVEADGNHIFMSAKRGCDGKLVLRWMEWANAEPRMVSKTIGVANKEELEAYAKWCAEERKKEFAKKWDATRKAILEKAEQERKAKAAQKKTKAVCWID